jgi:pimeloyl-ACP methyl ester carboxylesterase
MAPRPSLRWSLIGVAALVALALLVGMAAPRPLLDGWFQLQRWRAGAIERSVQVDDHRWVWLEAGEGPPLVLLHGFTGMKENWLELMPLLASSHRVIAPDLPGWGGSTRLDGADYGYAAQAFRLNAFLATLGLEETVVVGHSMGGGIAAVAASQHPQGLVALVLMDAAGVRFRENAFGRAVQDGGHPFAVVDGADLDAYLRLVFDDPPWVPWPLDHALVLRRRADRGFETRVLDAVGRGDGAFVPQQAAPAIAVPTLLLWCRDDRIIDASAASIYAALIQRPPTETVMLDRCNHMPMLERTAAVAEALGDFVRVHAQ